MSLIDHAIILHRPWRTITTCARDCVSIPSINMWTFNSIFKEIVNYMAHSKTKCKREEYLTKPSTWTLGLKKALTENTRLALLADHRRLNCWERVAPVTAHNELKTSQKAEHIFVTLEISLIISFSPAPAESLHSGIWHLDFRSNDFAENVDTCLGGP